VVDLLFSFPFPQNISADVNLGNALASENGHLEEGIAELTEGVDLVPESGNAHNGFGAALALLR